MSSAKFATLSIAALVSLCVLLGLGTWQLQRMEWKEGLLATLEQRAKADPVGLREALEISTRSQDDIRFLKVKASGRYRHDLEYHIFGTRNGTPGWRIVTPLVTTPGAAVLVIRGFVPEDLKRPEDRLDGQVDTPVDLVGKARYGEPEGTFSPENDVAGNQWYWRDLSAMMRQTEKHGLKVMPFFLELETAAHSAQWPLPDPIGSAKLHNRHFQYALTWYGLAATLLVVYAFVFAARKKA